MGYSYYFYKIKLSEIEKIKNISVDDFDSEVYFPEAFGQEKVFDFGKLYWDPDDTDDKIYSTGVPLFSDNKVMEMLADHIPYVVGKQGLLMAIDIYKNKIIRYLESLNTYENLNEELNDRLRNWKLLRVIDYSEENKYSITNSWLYEYSIFNLAHLLKTIDWEKETLLFYGG